MQVEIRVAFFSCLQKQDICSEDWGFKHSFLKITKKIMIESYYQRV